MSTRAMVLGLASWLLCVMLTAARPAGGAEDGERWARETLARLTVDEKVGQLVMPSLEGGFHHLDDPKLLALEEAARAGRIGGLVVFAGDPLSTAAAVARLQRAARVPLLVAADYEWGAAMRLEGATRFPRAMAAGALALGSGSDPAEALVREMGAITAREARAVGIQVVLAPVLDLASASDSTVIGTRSFGADPRLVARLGTAFVEGVQGAGALAVAKHFPGHGGTGIDSHLRLPVVDLDGARLREQDLAPFRAAVGTGIAGVMVAHVAYPGLDRRADRPASRSPEILDDILRGELRFEGLVLADALDMKGASGTWDGAVAAESVAAGVDVLLVPPDPRVAWDAVVRATRRGELDEARLDAAVLRVLEAKARLGLASVTGTGGAAAPSALGPDLGVVMERVGDPRGADVARRIAEGALTLLDDPNAVLPLESRAPPALLLLSVLRERDRAIDPRLLAEELSRRTARVAHRILPFGELVAPRLEPLAAEAEKAGAILIADYAHRSTGERAPLREWARRSAERGVPVIWAALGDPWVLLEAPQPPAGTALVATYDASPESQRALARALFGETAIRGRLPIRLSDTVPVGHGLERPARAARLEPSSLVTEHSDPRFELAPAIDVLRSAVADRVTAGAVALVGYRGEIVLATALGRTTYESGAPEVRLDTLYDLASLTKVVVTTTLAMLEVEKGRLALDASIAAYLPELRGSDKERVSVADLLAHSSGMLWWTDLYRRIGGLRPDEAKSRALAEVFALPLESAPGTAMVYSDLGILLLGEILERLGGSALDQLAGERIFAPLGMTETRYRPGAELRDRIAPTELDPWRGRVVHGEVHDENAAALGGVAPHAGLFSTAADLAVYAQFLLDGGVYGDARLLRGDTIARFTQRAGRVAGSSRALGWDTPSAESSAGRYFSASSFGHTGFTGTSLWIDPERDLFVVLLTNRVHPTRENRKISELRPRFHDAVVRALLGEGAPARVGAEAVRP